MSMLTPPGMGGQYRITGDKFPRMRRPRRRGRLVLALVASTTAIGLIGWGTLQLIDVFTGGGDSAAAAGADGRCPGSASPSPGAGASAQAGGAAEGTTQGSAAVPAPGKITVNVLNATTRAGLAKKTADELAERGFKIGEIGNAAKQYDKKVKGTGILLGPSASLNTSLPVLATQLAGAERRTDAGRKGTEVDLILGDAFKQLAARATADQALTALTSPSPTPSGTSKGC
ncbi:LytR C-terminal domain-containing protein [Streptomyces sp. NPDC056716]|uniref:LytR C-terminal domain-containing protein n=1 Tax=unclassified Streptomyces TaxID=2593676 RepID=UPI0036A35E6C